MLIKLLIFVVLSSITMVHCDVSHLAHGTSNSVDESTIEVLRKNITSYLEHVGNVGSPQMQLMKIYGATKQIVSGTLYTVQTLLETPEGAKKCEIRVLEKPWLDFCQVHISCENAGEYEYTFNPSQQVSNSNEYHNASPQLQQYIPSVIADSIQHLLPVTTTTTQKPFVYQISTKVPELPIDYQPQSQRQHDFQPVQTLVPTPEQPVYNQLEQHEKQNGIPRAVLPPPPQLNIVHEYVPQETENFNNYLHSLFADFMEKYQRQYVNIPGEKEYRYGVFKNNYIEMYEHAITDQVAKYSVTEFSDLTADEFSRILGYIPNVENFGNLTEANVTLSGDIPEKYDERDENLVTRVRLQGDCGACWAFTTIVAIEGLCAKRTKKLQEFSEQSLLDCDAKNLGCKGGYSPTAIKHIIQRGGLELEATYPYVFAKSTCKFNPKNVRVKVAEAIKFKKNDEEFMKVWLFKNGPIIVGINSAPLKYYKNGILSPTPAMCNPKKIDHNVALIGYGVDVDKKTGKKLPYWIAKNSWGSRWGEEGFFRIARNNNTCGLSLWASSVRLADVPNNCLLPNGK